MSESHESGQDLKAIGERLRREREARGWSRPEMARRLLGAANITHGSIDSLKRQMARWERGENYPRDWAKPYSSVFGLAEEELLGKRGTTYSSVEDTAVRNSILWIAATNTSDDAIEQIDRSASYLAEVHGTIPARNMLKQVIGLQEQTQTILRSGKQKLRQTRELLRLSSDLYTHSCLLLGDLGNNRRAAEHGTAALMFAQEAGSDQSISWSVQAKTARWRKRYVESAEYARRGFERSRKISPTKVELAYREANAIALFGDFDRAREAAKRAEGIADSLTQEDTPSSVWGFPAERQAVFALAVAIYTGEVDSALRAVEMADASRQAGNPKIPATYAQIQAGSGVLHLMQGEFDRAEESIHQVINLPREFRIGTVIGYLEHLIALMNDSCLSPGKSGVRLREEIRDFIRESRPTGTGK